MKPELIQSPHQAPPERGPSRSELDRYLRRAHCLRAAAFSHLLKRVAGSLRALLQRLEESRDRRRAIADLSRLDARTLKDIGLERGRIPMIVEQLIARRRAEQAPGKAYPLRALATPPAPEAAAEDDERCPPLAA
jgi:uncharacterized protein YjiS (DUF1127 family)